jgi:hypothetical protein
MLTYEPLEKYLLRQTGASVTMTFAEVERVTGSKLPPSAHKRNEWWSNNATNHSQARAWLNAGFETANLDRKAKKIVFRRVAHTDARHGMQEEPRMFKLDETFTPPAVKVTRHPASGAMKGTFTIEPGYDLTRPMLDEEEIAEWEAKLGRIADESNARLRGKR